MNQAVAHLHLSVVREGGVNCQMCCFATGFSMASTRVVEALPHDRQNIKRIKFNRA